MESKGDSNTIVKRSPWTELRNGPLRVALIGSGNWGCAIAKIIGQNTRESHLFESRVNMWVFEEKFNGRKLSEIINTTHINEKYMPGVRLPDNIVAEPDLRRAVKDAHILVFVVPHQFIQKTCATLQGYTRPGAFAISLIKGFDYVDGKINLMSEYIREALNVECSVLMGANVAKSVAVEQFSETTIGYADIETAPLLQQLFDRPYFRVNCLPDVAGVEICGALKNIVALGAGFCDGLNLGSNSKSAILRIGFQEIRQFAMRFYDGVIEDTFWDSCGFADLVTTCLSGRNRRCAEAFCRSGQSWAVIEKELLKGQRLQGTLTAQEVHEWLSNRGGKELLDDFPLFTTVYRIAFEGLAPDNIYKVFMGTQPRPIIPPRAKL